MVTEEKQSYLELLPCSKVATKVNFRRRERRTHVPRKQNESGPAAERAGFDRCGQENLASVLLATSSVDRDHREKLGPSKTLVLAVFGREKLGVGSVAILFRGQKTG